MIAADRAYEDRHAPVPERGLWAAVLHQALDDAVQGKLTPSGWIGSQDFAMVCHMADMDPAAMREGFFRQLSRRAA